MAVEKKKFFIVNIPSLNKEIEVYGHNPSFFENKVINLDLTSELRGKGIQIKFVIKSSSNNLYAHPFDLNLMGSYIRRMMRKGTDYVQDSIKANIKDYPIQIKVFLITRKKVSKRVKTALRNTARKEIIEYLNNKSFENVILDILNNKIQKDLLIKLKKIYPLALCEINSFAITQKVSDIKTPEIKEKNLALIKEFKEEKIKLSKEEKVNEIKEENIVEESQEKEEKKTKKSQTKKTKKEDKEEKKKND